MGIDQSFSNRSIGWGVNINGKSLAQGIGVKGFLSTRKLRSSKGSREVALACYKIVRNHRKNTRIIVASRISGIEE